MRTSKSLSALAVSGLTYAALGLMPGGVVAGPAALAASSPFCSASDLVNAGSQPAAASGRGDGREPDLGEVHEDLPAAAKGRADRSFKATVPVYFHVVTDGATGAVTGDQIAAQISVLNNTYAGGEGGARSGFTVGQAQRMRDAWLYYRAGA